MLHSFIATVTIYSNEPYIYSFALLLPISDLIASNIFFVFFLFAANFLDASSSNEAVHLQQRLKSLSSELVTLRNRLHVDQTNVDVTLNGDTTTGGAVNLVTSSSTANLTNGPFVTNHSNMQIGTSTILPVGKTNPKVSTNNNFIQLSLKLISE